MFCSTEISNVVEQILNGQKNLPKGRGSLSGNESQVSDLGRQLMYVILPEGLGNYSFPRKLIPRGIRVYTAGCIRVSEDIAHASGY